MNNPKDLKKLQAQWYKKLKDAGFSDIELNENDLKVSSMSFAIGHSYTRELWEAKETYYRLAEHFLNEHKFESEIERTIWEYHANAISVRNIANLLQQVKIKNYTKSKVHCTVQKLAKIMKKKYGIIGKERTRVSNVDN